MAIIVDIIAYAALGAFLSWIFYFLKRKDLLGGFIGGAVIGMIGSVLGVYFFSKILGIAIDFLNNGFYITNVDVLSGLVGGYVALYIFNRINHDRTRKDY